VDRTFADAVKIAVKAITSFHRRQTWSPSSGIPTRERGSGRSSVPEAHRCLRARRIRGVSLNGHDDRHPRTGRRRAGDSGMRPARSGRRHKSLHPSRPQRGGCWRDIPVGGAQAVAALAFGSETIRLWTNWWGRVTSSSPWPRRRSTAGWASTCWPDRVSWWSSPTAGRQRIYRLRHACPARTRFRRQGLSHRRPGGHHPCGGCPPLRRLGPGGIPTP